MRQNRSSPTDQRLVGLLTVLILILFVLIYVALRLWTSTTAAPAPINPPTGGMAPAASPTSGGAQPTRADSAPTQTTGPVDSAPTATLPFLASATPRPLSGAAEAVLAQMSLEQKAGQMIIGVIPKQSARGEGEMLVRDHYAGGIIYFSINLSDAEGTAALSRDLQAIAAGNNPAVPLFIAIDHEGGRKSGFSSGVTDFPSFMALGAVGSPQLASMAAAQVARELRAAGINLTFGPVVDVNTRADNPVIVLRSFGSQPQPVAQLGRAYMSALQENGLISVAKHFPGHGDTNIDSHGDIPYIDLPIETLRTGDLVPFGAVIEGGIGGIMAGHIANRQIDPEGWPTTLSPLLLEGLLRGELGYQGVIFSDSLMMGAIKVHYSKEEATLRAVLAGCDMLLYTNPHEAIRAHEQIVAAVKDGSLPLERVDASALRVLRLKEQYGLLQFPLPEPPPVNQNHGQAVALDIAQEALYLHGPANLPLIATPRVVLLSPDTLPDGKGDDARSRLGELLAERGLQVDEWRYAPGDPASTDSTREQALASLPGDATVVLVTWDAFYEQDERGNPAQAALVQAAAASGRPTVIIPADSPYDLLLIPPQIPALVPFGALEVQIQALAEALLSTEPPTGDLPVALQ